MTGNDPGFSFSSQIAKKKKKKKKKNPGFGKNRVGRVSGNPTFFFLGLKMIKFTDY